MTKVILTVGYARSGKSTVAHYLAEKHGYKRIGFSDFITIELAKRKLEITKTNMTNYGKQFRKELGEDYLIKQVLAEAAGHEKVVISGIRLMGEYDTIKEKFSSAKMIFTIAPEKQRYARRKDQSKTFEEFIARDKKDEELYKMREVFAKRDYEIKNEGSLEELLKKVDDIIKGIN